MRKLDTALRNSKSIIDESNAQRISREHALIVESIKTEFGITDFNKENESVKKSIRSLILEMWNPKTGITEKGLSFVNEGALTLTPESTSQQVASYIRKQIMGDCRGYAKSVLSVSDFRSRISEVCANVVELTKGMFKKTDAKAVIAKYLAMAITTETGISLDPKK